MYYNGQKLLKTKDLNGNRPELFLCTTNRSAGKTTFFSKMLVDQFLKDNSKFTLIYRFSYEINEVADKFFKDIRGLFFHNYTMTEISRAKGTFHELFLNNKSCGYAVALNTADQLKKYSHLFSDVKSMFFDEFQSETNHYCTNEISKFISVHTSFARGNGEMVRYLPVYMCSNPVSLINPYYTELGISERLRSDTKFLRGDGFVLENGFIEEASKAQLSSGFNRAFSNNTYVAYAAQNIYLNDNTTFIQSINGPSRYLGTLRYKGHDFGLREYAELGVIYCTDRADNTFKTKVTVTTEDHNINYVMLKSYSLFLEQLRYYFDHGCFRFKSLKCKEAILKALSY